MEISDFLQGSFLFLVKVGLIIFLIIYNIFSFIVVKQVKIMTEAVKLGLETPIKLLSITHLLFSLIVLILAFLVL